MPTGLTPIAVDLLVILIGAIFGFQPGYAINPARDFGPRLFTAYNACVGNRFPESARP